jgi:hypothetical protein
VIPRLGSAVFESLDGEVGRGGVVIELGEDFCTVVNQFHGRPQYHLIPYDKLDPSLGEGTYINRAGIRRLIADLARDEVQRKRPLMHDPARRALAHVLAELGDPLMYQPGRP